MSAISSTAQPNSSGDSAAVPPVPPAEINASCRAPILYLFVAALGWLLLSSVFELIASLKFHAPGLLADCPFFTYGRVHPAQMNAFIYGFAMQAGLGVALWLIAHLGKTRLVFGPGVFAGGIFWNLGVTLGLGGILWGDSTGFEWFEMPRYALVPMFFGFRLNTDAMIS